ncbi:hypothetical protein MMC14_000174 [Varicellaria rhodocarpa]|nr:hypothetical protein [Varicellaria rhodocarpa]
MRHTTARSTKPSFMSRLRARNNRGTTTTTTTKTVKTTRATHDHHTGNAVGATHHQHRRPSFGDKVSGAMMKLKGSLLHRPGLKAAGTRRQHGTDGRGSHRTY